ncbi:MAG: glycerophosphodiester phosphodiesterase [Polyangiales bacterium]
MNLVDRASVAFAHAYERLVHRSASAVSPHPARFIGHRGTKDHPGIRENSLAAFAYALDRGAGLETDLRRTLDGRVVLHHDVEVKPGGPRIPELTLGEIRAFAPEVATLEELFETTADRCPRYWLEIKEEDTPENLREVIRRTVTAAQEHGVLDRVGFLSLDGGLLRLARAEAAAVPRMYVYIVSPREGMRYLEEDPDAGLAGWFFTFPLAKLEAYRAEGRPTGVGFIEHRGTAARFAKHGFDYLFSDTLRPLAVGGSGEIRISG